MMLKTYFWCAERTEPSEAFPHLNKASGVVTDYNVQSAIVKASAAAKAALGNTKQFTITAFNNIL